MKHLALLCLLGAAHVASFADLVQHEEWTEFKLKHKKVYGAAEDELRKLIFLESKLKVARHNELYQRRLRSFEIGVNWLSDMLHSEYLQTMTKPKAIKVNMTSRQTSKLRANGHLPRMLDWTKKGAVTPVQQQGKTCLASWAFTAAGALEGHFFLKTGTLVSLSAQNLLDCSWGYDNLGCKGGEPAHAFEYVLNNGGIADDENYPYHGSDQQCNYNAEKARASCAGYVEVAADEAELLAAVATAGPVTVSVDASQPTFRDYSAGVYYDERCSSDTDNVINMLVVGYSRDPLGGDYWLVKNSWGTDWGLGGFMKIARNRDNHCGIASDATYPLV